jgi:ribosomal-protein-alanine N-acetyltransferase
MIITLQRLTSEFLPQIQMIDQAGLGSFWSLSAYAKELDSPNSYLIGAIGSDQSLLGFGCLWRIVEEAHITMLVVHPAHQRRGIGRLILWGMLDKARTTGAEWAVLEVRESNRSALHLYGYFGFAEVGRRKNYYQDTGESALILWCKSLQESAFETRLKAWRTSIITRLAAVSYTHLTLPTKA